MIVTNILHSDRIFMYNLACMVSILHNNSIRGYYGYYWPTRHILFILSLNCLLHAPLYSLQLAKSSGFEPQLWCILCPYKLGCLLLVIYYIQTVKLGLEASGMDLD